MIKEIMGASGAVSADKMAQLLLLLETPEGTVPLDRSFGISTDVLDMPCAVAQNLLAADIAVKIEKYIPGLALKEVSMRKSETDGEMRLKVVVEDV